jgi:hypothetical protein
LDQLYLNFRNLQKERAPLDRRRIAVDAEQAATWPNRLREEAGVPATTEGGVHEDTPRSGLKKVY